MLPEGSNIVVHLVESQEVGYEFQRTHLDWPQHITFLHWFTVPPESEALAILERTADNQAPFSVMVGEDAWFGPDNDVHVQRIVPSEESQQLHLALMQAVRSSGAVFVDQRYMGEQYRPYITYNRQTPPHQGHSLFIGDLTLVQFIGEESCRVMQHFTLGSRNENAT